MLGSEGKLEQPGVRGLSCLLPEVMVMSELLLFSALAHVRVTVNTVAGVCVDL